MPMETPSDQQDLSKPTTGRDGLIKRREDRLGEIFGVEPGLLLKIPKDLTTLSIIVGKHLALNGKQRLNGEMEPMENKDLRQEVLKLVGRHKGLTHASRNPVVRMKPSPHSGRYDSSYIHSDMWSGHPAGCIVMFPIFGDFETGGVEFFKPRRYPELMEKTYGSYKDVPDFGSEYIGRMEPGYMYVVDAFCLHRTLNGGKRVSVDMRFAIDSKMNEKKQKRVRSYLPIWDDIEGRN